MKSIFCQLYKMSLLTIRDINIPKDKLTTSFCRSSGPGGQHVNKTSSKAEIRFHVQDADWIEERVKNNLQSKYSNYINKDGELILTSQMSRVQERNLEDAISRLKRIILECSQPEKKEFIVRPPSENQLKKRVQEKRRRSEVKKNRSIKNDW